MGGGEHVAGRDEGAAAEVVRDQHPLGEAQGDLPRVQGHNHISNNSSRPARGTRSARSPPRPPLGSVSGPRRSYTGLVRVPVLGAGIPSTGLPP